MGLATPSGRAVIWLVTTLLLLVSASGVAVATTLHDYRQHWNERVVAGAQVNGVDLTGMTLEEAAAAIERQLAPRLDRRVTLRFDDQTWETTPRELGATTNARELARRAVDASRDLPWITLAQIRWRDATVGFDATATIVYPEEHARELAARVAEVVHVPAVDAELTWTRSRPVVTAHRQGREVDVDATVARLMDAVRGDADATVDVVAHPVEPEVTSAHYRRILFLRQDAHRLELWEDGRRVRGYVVAVGTGDYPTPTGLYHVSKKRSAPVWINPDPDGWGRDLPERIEPGADNPLGLRALNWDAPGAIRFHGTANVDSLGRDASHGCVRLSNADILDLFERVEVGDHIVSLG